MTLTTDFMDDPVAFANDHAICPPSNISGYKGKLAKELDTSGYSAIGPSSGNAVGSIKYSRVMRNKKVGYIEMYDDMRSAIEDRNMEGVGATRMRADFEDFGEAQPMYFLPWDEGGAIVKLRIPAEGELGVDPNIFFTAAINGCSVFVQGDPASPTVYHAGGNTGRSTHNDAARFWRHALGKHIASSRTAKARGIIKGEVNKTHYIKTPGTIGNSTTPTAEHYEKELQDRLNQRGSFTVTMVNPWGCVFGVREAGTWKFYLQENATVVCHHVTPTGVRQISYARPMKLNQIFPGSPSMVSSMSHDVPVRVE